MKIPSCSLAVWKNLFDAALNFRHIEPWEWMSDSDVFGIQNPEGGEIGYCCVLGALGEVLGLVVYLGTEGLEQHRKIQSGKLHAGSPEFLYSQHCLTAWFGDRSELDKNDLKVIKQLGLKFHGSNAWPQFRSFHPGYYPWHLTESEAGYLTLCLEQARDVALCLEKDPDWLSAPHKNHYLVRVPVDDPSQAGSAHKNSAAAEPSTGQQLLFEPFDEPHGWRWKNEWLKPAPLTRARVRPSIDEVRLQRIKNSNQTQHGIWEIDAFYTPNPVDGDDRPFFPYTYLCADHDSGFLFDSVLAEPSMWQAQFCKSFLEGIETHKLIPNTLWVRKEELRELFEPVAIRLGIEVRLTGKLPAIDRAKRELLKFLKSRG
jgi:Domain of unknown function (DUF6930)